MTEKAKLKFLKNGLTADFEIDICDRCCQDVIEEVINFLTYCIFPEDFGMCEKCEKEFYKMTDTLYPLKKLTKKDE